MSALTVPETDLILDISPNDTMDGGDAAAYLTVGRSALANIQLALRAAGKPADEVRQVLDLPCGHGRVLRHLKHAFPRATIFASDLDRDGVDYCAAMFGATPVYSEDDPTRLPIDPDFLDLIWVGSLLTHFTAAQWRVFLDFFRSCLRPGGVLVFTSHGRLVHHRLASGVEAYDLPKLDGAAVLHSYERTGFGYAHYPELRNYGFSLSHPSWVLTEVGRLDDLRLVHFAEAGWADHQDVVAYAREPRWTATRLAGEPPRPRPAGRNGTPGGGGSTVDAAFFDRIDQARGYIDTITMTGHHVVIQGWMLHPDNPISHLRLYLDNRLVGAVEVGDRPDVAGAFPDIPHADKSGVRVRLPFPAGDRRRAGRADLVGSYDGRPVALMSTRYRADLEAAVPAPPEDLMHRVANVRDAHLFKVWGLKCHGDFQDVFARHGAPTPADRLLDWGCGCGRLSAHFLADPDGPEVYGCDVDGEGVAYCNAHLKDGRFQTLDPYPPTGYEDGYFQYAIGYSVFTHLTRDVQLAWLAELRRVLAPGALFVATVHGESATEFAFPGRVSELLATGLYDGDPDAVLDGIVPPGYYRATYQSEEYTRREWGKLFDIVEYKVRGVGNHQDAVVMRRPA